MKEFDALLAKHKGEKTDDVAQILLMEAMLYLQVLDNNEKGAELIKQLQRDFPDTKPAENADKILASMKKQEEAKKIKGRSRGRDQVSRFRGERHCGQATLHRQLQRQSGAARLLGDLVRAVRPRTAQRDQDL